MIFKNKITFILFIVFFVNSPNLLSQSSIETLNIVLERKFESENNRLQRDHEMNMMALDFKLRNQSIQLQQLYNSYQLKIDHFSDINLLLTNFGLDFSEQLLNSLSEKNNISSIAGEINFYRENISILNNLMNDMRNALTYISRGETYANQVERDLAIEYFELFHKQEDQILFEEYTEKILSQFASYDSGISREQRGYMYYGIQYTLLTESHYQKAKEQKESISNLIERERIFDQIMELSDQRLALQEELIELHKEVLSLSEIKSNVEDKKRKENLLNLQILVAKSKIDSIDLEIKKLEIEKIKYD